MGSLSHTAALEQAVSIAEETGDRAMLGNALSVLGVIYTLLKEIDLAVERLTRAEQCSAEIGNRRQEARAAWLLGCALDAAALAAMERALEHQVPEEVAHTRTRIVRLRARLARSRTA